VGDVPRFSATLRPFQVPVEGRSAVNLQVLVYLSLAPRSQGLQGALFAPPQARCLVLWWQTAVGCSWYEEALCVLHTHSAAHEGILRLVGEVVLSADGSMVGLAYEGPACHGLREPVQGASPALPGPLVLLWALDVLCALDHLHSASIDHPVAHGNVGEDSIVVLPGVARRVAKLAWVQPRHEVPTEALFKPADAGAVIQDVVAWAGTFLGLGSAVAEGFPEPVVRMLEYGRRVRKSANRACGEKSVAFHQ
jgi:hypothetical protein